MESRDLAKRRFAIEAACEALEARLLLAHLARADWGDWARTIGLAQAHDLFPDIDGTGAVIVDIDTGFELEDPRFPGAVTTPAPLIGKNQAGVSFVDTTVDDVQGHGTFMVSQMLADEWRFTGGDNLWHRGVAPGARVIPLKVSNNTNIPANLVEAALDWVILNRAARNISGVNLSFSNLPADYDTYDDELAELAAAGVFITASAGQNQSSTENWNEPFLPARDPNVFGISASGIVNAGGKGDILYFFHSTYI